MSFLFKKIFVLNIIVILLLGYNSFIIADDEIDNVDVKDIDKVIQTSSNVTETPKINSRYAVVLDRNSKAVIYGKNENTKTKMASTTKIMTALVVIENTNLSNIVEVSGKAAATGGSRLKIKKGDKVGRVKYICDGELIGEVDVIAAEDADRIGFFDILLRFWQNYCIF